MAGLPVVLVTANVGSIFEEPEVMMRVWTEEFLSTISRLDPKFIALHCQEVGGKNYEDSMKNVEEFVRILMDSEELRLFDKVRVYLDEDFSSPENFTALGNLYFVHESLKDVLLWDFKEAIFLPAKGKEIHTGNIEAVTTKEKAKFPQQFFPECKWSRKGFLRTRWSISGTIFDLINIHLFHDASNLIAMETFPSVYSTTRRIALEHTLQRFHSDRYLNAPYFIFGDFNFRTDAAGVIKKLTEDTQESQILSKGNISKLQFRNKEDDLILTLGKKEFTHCMHQKLFFENGGQWLREFDKELEVFNERLFEFPINFVPSYPFEEDVQQGTNYMQTRVPGWCDRILLSPAAKNLVENIQSNEVEYGIMGSTICMGDHKPVYLRVLLASDAGMINCCEKYPEVCFRVPDNYSTLFSMLLGSHISAKTLAADCSSNLLHATPIKHDPYTPDSVETPSPNVAATVGDSPDLLEPGTSGQSEAYSRFTKSIDRAFSPALLKSKLELIFPSKRSLESEQEIEFRKSPSECRLHSWSDTEDSQLDMRTNRSNSDASAQRKKLSQASDWVQGKDDPVSSRNIPLIEISSASNMQSNESSIYLHDDRLSCTYSEDRTKSVSVEGSLQEKTEDLGDKIEEDILDSQIDDSKIDDSRFKKDKAQIIKSETHSTLVGQSKQGGEKRDDQSLNTAKSLSEGLEASEQSKGSKSKILEQEYDGHMIEENLDTNAGNDIEFFNTLTSNSSQSQDSSDNSRKVKLKKKVTEKCKKNISNERGQCRKCCCTIS